MTDTGAEQGGSIAGPHHCYLFEAKGIQRYILAGGRLLDIAGGSELLAQTVNSRKSDLLERVLDAAGFSACEPQFSRRAAGAFALHFKDDMWPQFERFRALWRLAFAQHAPALEFSEAFGCGEDAAEAKDDAYRNASQLRENGTAALLPRAGPFVARSPRTALPGVERRDQEIVDRPTARKRGAGREKGFAARFLPVSLRGLDLRWPDQMEDEGTDTERKNAALFPFEGEDRRVAIVHADISGLGELYATANKMLAVASGRGGDAIRLARDLSDRIENAVEGAAQIATDRVLAEPLRDRDGTIKAGALLPARPILLGGDDLTIIVRADLAIPYVRKLLEQIEELTAAELTAFNGVNRQQVGDLDIERLTACAGIAIVKPKQPFHLALDLAEGLCSYAKKYAKAGGRPFASALAFHRVTSSHIADDFDEIVGAEETCSNGAILTAQPYGVGRYSAQGVAALASLEKLKNALTSDTKPGPLRELKTLLLSERTAGFLSRPAYRNWRKVAKGRGAAALDAFDDALRKLGVPNPDTSFFDDGAIAHTPLFDALEWRACE